VKKDGDIVSYTPEELRAMIARGEDLTDWARVDAMTEAELEAAIANDPAWADIPRDWYKHATPITPRRCARRSSCASTPTWWPGSSDRDPAIRPCAARLRPGA
jgi:hypothetical protein